MPPAGTSIERVMVLGSGVMGLGIAKVFARAGLDVAVYRHRPKAGVVVPEGARLVHAFDGEAPDLVIESVYERFDLKVQVLRRAEADFAAGTILASNTSGLPLQEIGDALDRPQRFCGIHWFMPAEVSPLVEVVRIAETADSVVEAVVAALARADREALLIEKPVVGYLWNRLQHAILREAYHLIENGIARTEDIDKVAKRLLGPRFCVTGLVESKDIGGVGVHVDAHGAIVPHLCRGQEATSVLRRMVDRGDLGIRSGRGFYDWGGLDPETVSASAKRRLERLNRFLEQDMAAGEPDTAPSGVADVAGEP